MRGWGSCSLFLIIIVPLFSHQIDSHGNCTSLGDASVVQFNPNPYNDGTSRIYNVISYLTLYFICKVVIKSIHDILIYKYEREGESVRVRVRVFSFLVLVYVFPFRLGQSVTHTPFHRSISGPLQW